MPDPHQRFFAGWSRFYESTPLLAPLLRAQQDEAIARLDPRPGQRILDLGCGPGRGLQALLARGAFALGVDPSAEMIRDARAATVIIPVAATASAFVAATADAPRAATSAAPAARPFGPGAAVVRALAGGLPFKSGTLDGVLCTNSFHHYPEPLSTLREIRRVLAPGGRAVLVDPNLAHPAARLAIYGGEALLFGLGVHLHAPEEWKQLCRDAGFSSVAVEPLAARIVDALLVVSRLRGLLVRLPGLAGLGDPTAVSLCVTARA